jgi:hypothetical protein
VSDFQRLAFPSWNIEAKTAEEMNGIATADGLRRWLRSRRNCPLIYNTFRQAEMAGCSGEETYARLAYNALIALEKMHEDYTQHLNRCVNPPVIVQQKPR